MYVISHTKPLGGRIPWQRKANEDRSAADEVGLYDTVELYLPEDGETETVRVVTTVRADPLKGLISRESPLGRVLLGKKTGDRFEVRVREGVSYTAEVRTITKNAGDDLPLLEY